MRDHAAYLLGRIGDPSAAPALIQALADQEPKIRAAAYNPLARFANDGDERARKAVASYAGPKLPQPAPR